MQVNRYTTPVISRYNPLSMQELSFAPSILRQRHDEALQSASMLESQLGNYDVHENFLNEAEQLTQPLKQNIESLVDDLTSQGVNRSQAVNRAMKLAGEYSNLFAPSGGIGQLQQRTGQYRQQVEDIKKFYKDNPELAAHKIAQLNIGKANINPNTGRVELGDMSVPNMYRHIADEDIMKQLNDVAKGLKASDFGDLGLQGLQNVGSFQDVLTFADSKGVDATRIMNAMISQIGPEAQNSITQYGELYGLDPDKSMQNFTERVAGLARASAYEQRDRQRMRVTDEWNLHLAKKGLEEQTQSFNSWEYDPTTQEISPMGMDESFFELQGYDGVQTTDGQRIGTGTAARHGVGGTPFTKDTYKPFNAQQEIDAFEIISSITGKDISEIPRDFINTKKGRDILKGYYQENKGKIQIQPTIDNTDYLREYGGDPNKASQDLYSNYQSRILFDVKEGRQLTPQEFEKYLSNGKLEVKGVYSSENPFGFMADNAQPASMASPLAVNLKDDDGKVIKTFAVSRSPSYSNSINGFYDTQFNSIFNDVQRVPNIERTQVFTFANEQNQKIEIPIKVKYETQSKQYVVRPISGEMFKPFRITKIQDLAEAIKENAN